MNCQMYNFPVIKYYSACSIFPYENEYNDFAPAFSGFSKKLKTQTALNTL